MIFCSTAYQIEATCSYISIFYECWWTCKNDLFRMCDYINITEIFSMLTPVSFRYVMVAEFSL